MSSLSLANACSTDVTANVALPAMAGRLHLKGDQPVICTLGDTYDLANSTPWELHRVIHTQSCICIRAAYTLAGWNQGRSYFHSSGVYHQ